MWYLGYSETDQTNIKKVSFISRLFWNHMIPQVFYGFFVPIETFADDAVDGRFLYKILMPERFTFVDIGNVYFYDRGGDGPEGIGYGYGSMCKTCCI